MFRFASCALLAAALSAFGCDSLNFTKSSEPQKSGSVGVADSSARDENVRLRQQLDAAEAEKARLADEKTRMAKDQVALEGRISAADLNAKEWRKKYEAAKEAVPAGGEQVPPELMKAFIDLARAGGPWEVGEGGTLKVGSDVLFDSGRAELRAAGEKALKEIAPRLKDILADKRVILAVEGHTDSEPVKHSAVNFNDNRHLSLMRAYSAVTCLQALGLPPESLRAVGLGEFHPVATNDTKEGRAQNRRVELRLLNADSPQAKVPSEPPPAPVKPAAK